MAPSARGQALPYFLIMMVVLVMSWAMVINIAKLVRDRMMMQNAADNAALSCAVFRARTLNLIGQANYLMASALSAGAFPCLVPVPLCHLDYVGGSPGNVPFPFSDVNCRGVPGEYSVDYAGVNRLRFTVNALARFQRQLVLNYIPGTIRVAREIGRRQELSADGTPCGADEVIPLPGELAARLSGAIAGGGGWGDLVSGLGPERLLGLQRVGRKISYYKTINIGSTVSEHYHAVAPRLWCRDDVAWYRASDRFFQQKIVAVAIKKSSSPSNRGYPFLGGLAGMGPWPSVYAVAAAAVYDTKGPMFPTGDEGYTGIPRELIGPHVAKTAEQIRKMYRLAQDISFIPVIGEILGGSVAAATTFAAAAAATALVKAIDDDQTPVRAYEKAQYHGWDAHLVPIGEGALQH